MAPVKSKKPNSGARGLVLSPGASRNSGALQAPEAQLLDAFFRDKDPKTIRTYASHIEDFRAWIGASSPQEAAAAFLAKGQGNANLLAINFKSHLSAEKYAPSSINGHLTALRSLVRMARTLGMVPWSLEVPNVQNEAYRDTAGPGTEKFVDVMKGLEARTDPMGLRDRAILALIHDAGLRRDEAASLDLEHVDFQGHRLWVKAKKRVQRVEISMNADVERCLKDWIRARGDAPGAFFKNFDPAGKGERLTGSSIARVSHRHGLGHPHGLRHLAITEALDATNGDIRSVMKFSRHRDPKTLMIYDDKRRNVSGEISETLSRIRRGEAVPPAGPAAPPARPPRPAK